MKWKRVYKSKEPNTNAATQQPFILSHVNRDRGKTARKLALSIQDHFVCTPDISYMFKNTLDLPTNTANGHYHQKLLTVTKKRETNFVLVHKSEINCKMRKRTKNLVFYFLKPSTNRSESIHSFFTDFILIINLPNQIYVAIFHHHQHHQAAFSSSCLQ